VNELESPDKLNEEADLEFALLQVQNSALTQITDNSTVACGQQIFYNIFNQNG
jgi:hypothetical protein